MTPPIRALYVDDEPDLLEIGRLFLEMAGDFSVTTVESASAALELLEKEEFDAIISDYQMPGMDGIRFLVAVRERFGRIPFILFTGRGREEVVIQAINNGVDFYIQKGGEPEAQYLQLAHQVRIAVERQSTEKALAESELRFRSLIQNSSDIIRIVDRDGRITYESDSGRRILGYPEGYTIGKSPLAFIHPDDITEASRAIDEVFAKTNTGSATPVRVRRADGTYIHIEAVAVNLVGTPGVDGIVITSRPVDERLEAERALRQSEQRFLRAEEIAGIGHWEVNRREGTMTASKGAQAILGLERESWPLATMAGMLDQADLERMMAAGRDLIGAGSPLDVVYRFQRADGREVEVHAQGEYDPERDVLFGVLHDITDQKRVEAELIARNRELSISNEEIAAAEEELRSTVEELTRQEREARESRERLALVLEGGDVGTWDLQTTKDLVFNDPQQALAGEAGGEGGMSKEEWEARLHPDDRDRVRQAFQGILEGRSPAFEAEYRFQDGPGEWRWIMAKGRVVEWSPDGRPQRIAGTYHDITKQKEDEAMLTWFGRVLESSLNEIYTFDERTLRFVEVNRGAWENLGYTMDELREMTPLDLKPRIPPEEFDTLLRPLRAGEVERQVFFTVHRRKDGSLYPVEVHLQLMRHEMSPVFVAVILDITERVRSKEALIRANRVLNLLSGITRHDIDNQLTVMGGYLSLLHSGLEDPALVAHAEQCRAAADRIASMIRFTETCEHIGLQAPTWEDVRELVDRAAADVDLGGIRLENEVPADLEVYADPLIARVFSNLVDNAVRHGQGATWVRFSASEHEKEVTIVCEDDGVGVPEDKKERIFERGYGENTGFGLFLVREILQITGISIREIGMPGRGGRFELTMPATAARWGTKGAVDEP